MALGSGNIQIDVGARGFEDDIVSQVNGAQRRIQPLNLKLNDKGFRQPLGRISGDLSEFQNSLDASVARTLAFGAAVGVINAVASAFKGMITASTEVEKKLKDVNVILNLNTQALRGFSNSLFEVAKNTGTSFEAVSDAAVELARQGLGAEETLKRINDAMILTRLSGMEATKSVETLTAAINGFGSAALDTTQIINKLATVDAAFAVSTDDLANALARAGSTAQAAKVSMDELLGAVTSVQQMTARGGAVIGNAFKSIFTRIQRSSVREQLEGIGVATMDAAGNIRNAMSILKDYAQVYKGLSDGQRAYTDELLAGVFQINNLRALVKDLGSGFSVYERAMKQSAGATDEATRRNAELDKTMSALVNKSIVNVKQLAAALGGIVASPAVKNLLDLFNSISESLVKALDPEKGSKVIKGMFGAIGKFISGPGLILIGAAFIKLFKFITGQSLKAVKEVFKIKTATNQVAATEAKITHLLQQNHQLYSLISRESLSHAQKEQMVLQVINQENQALARQQQMISQLARSRSVQHGLTGAGTNVAKGYIPNLANDVKGALASEQESIRTGIGGASRGARPKVLKNFPTGKGKKETFVANTDEVVVPNYGGGSGSAILNPDMVAELGGIPTDAKPVARGFIPNFGKLKPPTEEQFYMPGGKMGAGANVDGKFYAMIQVAEAIKNTSKARDITIDQPGISRYAKLYTEELKRKKDPLSKDILNIPNLFLKNQSGEISPLTLREVTQELYKPQYKFQQLQGPKMQKPNNETAFYASMFDGFIPNFVGGVGGGKKGKVNESKETLFKYLTGGAVSRLAKNGQPPALPWFNSAGGLKNYIEEKSGGRAGPNWVSQILSPNTDTGEGPIFKNWVARQGMDYGKIASSLQGDFKKLRQGHKSRSAGREEMSNLQQNLGRVILGLDTPDNQNKFTNKTFFKKTAQGLRPSVDGKTLDGTSIKGQVNNPGSWPGGIVPANILDARKNITSGVGLQEVHFKIGGAFEKTLGALGGMHKKPGKEAMDYSRVKKRGITVPPNVRKAINYNAGTRFGDAEKGSGHGPAVMASKVINELTEANTLGRISGILSSDSFNLYSKSALPTHPFVDFVDQGSDSAKKWKVSTIGGALSKRGLKPRAQANLKGLIARKYKKGSYNELNKEEKGKVKAMPFNFMYAVDDLDLQNLEDDETLKKYGIDPAYLKESGFTEDFKELSRLKTQVAGGGFIPNFATNWSKTVEAYMASEAMAPAGAINLDASGVGAIIGGGSGKSLSSAGKVNSMGNTIKDSLPKLFGSAPLSSLGVKDPETGDAPPSNASIPLGEYLTRKRGTQVGGTFPMSSVYDTANKEKEISKTVGPQLFDAVRPGLESAASSIYNKVVPGQAGGISSKSMDPQRYLSTSTQGGLLEGAIRFGSDAIAGEFGAADAESAAWDFTATGNIPSATKNTFFSGSGVNVADAKRSVAAARGGEGSMIQKTLRSIVAGGPQNEFANLKTDLANKLFEKAQENEGATKGLTKFAANRTKTQAPVDKKVKSAFDGFVPNFAPRSGGLGSGTERGGFWSPADSGSGSDSLSKEDHFKKNSYGRKGGELDLRSFFPKSGSLAIGNLFKDVMAMAQAGTPYNTVSAGEIVGPRIPKMLVTAKRFLDKKRGAGLKQPPMKIDGYLEPYDLFNSLQRNKNWYEAEKDISKKKGKEFKPSQPGSGIQKAPLSSKYVPKEEQALKNSFKELGLPVNNEDARGGFKEFDRYYLKNLPLFRGGFAEGFIPNYKNEKLEGLGPNSDISNEDLYGGRALNIGYLSSEGGSGSQIFKNLLKQITGAAKEGRPYTGINAGSVVGPRIPSVLIKAKRILDRQRAGGQDIPFMKMDGFMNPPAQLLEKLGKKKREQQESGVQEVGRNQYQTGEEKELAQSFKTLGLNPESWQMVDLNSIPMLQNFSGGFIPNFAKKMDGKLLTPEDDKGKGSSELSSLQKRWIQAIRGGEEIGKTMGLGKGGTESRATMPQLSKEAQARFEKDLTTGQGIAGEVLGGKKVKISQGVEKVAGLRATQKDIYGDNVRSKLEGAFGADKWDKEGSSNMPGWLSAAIMVSQGNRIVDGHHRWATVYARDAIDDGKIGGLSMKTNKIGLPIQTLLKLTETYSGAKQAGGATGAAGGYVPNFADALEGAIVREKAALEEQGADAKIYVDKDSRLKGKENPMGLLVANTRDEPLAGSQGVDRALKGGVNPKNMGKAEGFIPTFAGSGSGGVSSGDMSGAVKWLEQAGVDLMEAAGVVLIGGDSLIAASDLLTEAASNIVEGGGGVQQQAAPEAPAQNQSIALPNIRDSDAGDSIGFDFDSLDANQIDEARMTLIEKFNKLGAAVNKEAAETSPNIERLKDAVKKMDLVGEELEEAGVDINKSIKDFDIKRVDLKGSREAVMGGKDSHKSKGLQQADVRGGEGLTKVFNKMMGPVDRLKGGVGKLASKFSGVGKAAKGFSKGIDFLSTKFFFIESGLALLNGVLEPFGLQLPTISGAIGSMIDTFKGIDRAAIEAGEVRSEQLANELKDISKLKEAADKFAGKADALNQALAKGDIEVAGKQLQSLMESMDGLGGIDSRAITEVIGSIGDSEKFKKAKADMDEAIGNNKALKEAEQDMENLGMEILKLGSNSEEVSKLIDESATTFSNVASKMVKNLSPEDLRATAEALKGVTITAGNASEVLKNSGPLYDQMSDGMKKLMETSPATTAGILKLAQEQSKYQSEMNRLMEEWKRLSKATEPLTPILSRLSTAMISAANATKSATDTLFEAAKKAAEVEGAKYQSQNVVTDKEAAVAQADFQQQSTKQQGAINIEAELAKIGPALLQGVAEGGTLKDVRDGVEGNPEVENLLAGIATGTATTGDSIMALDAAIKNSAGADKDSLISIRDAVHAAAAQEHSELAKIQSELKAQLAMMDIQNANLLKTQIASVAQLTTLNELKDVRSPGEGDNEVDRRIIADSLKKAADSMNAMGFGNTEGQANLEQAAMDETVMANIASSFKWATGGDFAVTGDNIVAMNQQIQDFIKSDGLENLNSAQQNAALGIAESVKNLSEQQLLDPTGRGGSKEMADKMTGALKLDQANLEQLSAAISQGMSEAMRELLGITEEQAAVFEGSGNQQATLAGEALTLNAKNVEIQSQNASSLDEIKTAMQQVATDMALNTGSLDNSASALSRAAVALENAANSLQGDSAAGFIPNFAQTGSVERAASTEKSMGGKPVVDSHPSVGTYVRDGKRQPNFAAVRRDHPEGMAKAVQNSARKQGVMAGGFIPNFAKNDDQLAKSLIQQYPDIKDALASINPEHQKDEDGSSTKLTNNLWGSFHSNFADAIRTYMTGKKVGPTALEQVAATSPASLGLMFPKMMLGIGKEHAEKLGMEWKDTENRHLQYTVQNYAPEFLADMSKKKMSARVFDNFDRKLPANAITPALKPRTFLQYNTSKSAVDDLIYGTEGPASNFINFLDANQSSGWDMFKDLGLADRGIEDFQEDTTDLGPGANAALFALDSLGLVTTLMAVAATAGTGGAAAPLIAFSGALKEMGKKALKNKITQKIGEKIASAKLKKEAVATSAKALAKKVLTKDKTKGFDPAASQKAIMRQFKKKKISKEEKDKLMNEVLEKSNIVSRIPGFDSPIAQGTIKAAKGLYNAGRLPDRLISKTGKFLFNKGIQGSKFLKTKAQDYFTKDPNAAWKAMTGLQYGAGYSMFALQDALDKNWQMESGEAVGIAQEKKMAAEGKAKTLKALQDSIGSREMDQADIISGMPQLQQLIDTQKAREGKMSGDQGGTGGAKESSDPLMLLPPNFGANLNQMWSDGTMQSIANTLTGGMDWTQSSDDLYKYVSQMPEKPIEPTVRQLASHTFTKGADYIPAKLFKHSNDIGNTEWGAFDTKVPITAMALDALKGAMGADALGQVYQNNQGNPKGFFEGLMNPSGEGLAQLMSSGGASFFGNSSFAKSYMDLREGIAAGTTPVQFPQSLEATAIDEKTGFGRLSDVPTPYTSADLASIKQKFTESKGKAADRLSGEDINAKGKKALGAQVKMYDQGISRASLYEQLAAGLFGGGAASLTSASFISNPKVIEGNALTDLGAGSPETLGSLGDTQTLLSQKIGFSTGGGTQSKAAEYMTKQVERLQNTVGTSTKGPLYDVLSKYYSPDLQTAVSSISPEAWGDASAQAKTTINASLENALKLVGLPEDFQENPELEPAKWDEDGKHLGGGGTYSSDGKCFFSATGDPAPKSACAKAMGLGGAPEAEAAITTIDTGDGEQWQVATTAIKEVTKEKEEKEVATGLKRARNFRYSALMGLAEQITRDFGETKEIDGRDVGRPDAQAMVDRLLQEKPWTAYAGHLGAAASDKGSYGVQIKRLDTLIGSNRSLITEKVKDGYRKDKDFYVQAQAMAKGKSDLYENGSMQEKMADWLYMMQQPLQLDHHRDGAKNINFPRQVNPDAQTLFSNVVDKLFLDIDGETEAFSNIPQEVKEGLKGQAAMDGEFTPMKYLETDGWTKDPTKDFQDVWAKVATHPGNPKGDLFANEFAAADTTGREKLLGQLGLTAPQLTSADDFIGPMQTEETRQKLLDIDALTSTPGGEQWSFLMQSARHHLGSEGDPESIKSFGMALNQATGGNAEIMKMLNEGGLNEHVQEGQDQAYQSVSAGLNSLLGQSLQIRPNPNQDIQSTPAFYQEEIGRLHGQIMGILFPPDEDQNPGDGPKKPPAPAGDLVGSLKQAWDNANIDRLQADASFILSGSSDKSPAEYIKSLLSTDLEGKTDLGDNVPNIKAWKKWTSNAALGQFRRPGKYSNLPGGATALTYGEIPWEGINPAEYPGLRTPPLGNDWKDFLSQALGTQLSSGINTRIEALREGMPHYYSNIFPGLPAPDPAQIEALIANTIIPSDYAFTGKYPGKLNIAGQPPSMEFEQHMGALKQAPLLEMKKSIEEGAKEVASEDGVAGAVADDAGDTAAIFNFGKGGSARGFVPNFSKIAGEISASKEAGYSKAVTPSQVKTMNIPGRGKTSYNTQETVMRGAGMSQPFIVPPSNSKASKGYGQKVQKKFGFNPYDKAASGFIPNFESSAEVTAFMTSLSNFAEKIDVAGKVFGEAAQIFKDNSKVEPTDGPATGEINAQPIADAAAPISSSVSALNSTLSEGITLNDNGVANEMKTLSDSLQGLSIDMNLKVDDVNVNVNGAGAIEAQVQAAFDTNIKGVIASEIEGMKQQIIAAAVKEITG